jgi:farnesyl diphosphate synthase
MTKKPLKDLLDASAAEVETVMESLLPCSQGIEAPLFDAIRYSVLGGGKRLRSFMVLQSARLFEVEELYALRVAAAVEFFAWLLTYT